MLVMKKDPKKRRKKKKDTEHDTESQELERQLMDDAKLDPEQIVNEILHTGIEVQQPNDNDVILPHNDEEHPSNEEDKDSFGKKMEDIASIGEGNNNHVLQASNANFDTDKTHV